MYTDSVKNVDSPSVFNPPEYCLSANNLLPLGHGNFNMFRHHDFQAGTEFNHTVELSLFQLIIKCHVRHNTASQYPGNLLDADTKTVILDTEKMMLIFETNSIFISRTKTSAEILLQLYPTLNRTAVYMHVKNRHEYDDLVARLFDELIRVQSNNIRDSSICRSVQEGKGWM